MPLEDTLRKTLAAETRPPDGRSLRELGEACGVNKSTLHDFLAGRGSMRLDQAERLAAELGLRISVGKRGAR